MSSDLRKRRYLWSLGDWWSLMRECVSYPSPDTFSRVIGLTRRPLSREAAFLPDDPRLELNSGFDLSNEDEVKEKLEDVKDINGVTHVYLASMRPTEVHTRSFDIGDEWVMAQRDYWATWVHENGLTEDALEGTTWDILTIAMSLHIRTDYDLSANREIGFPETLKPAEGYILALERMKSVKILPQEHGFLGGPCR
ncbi:hypothetical protein DL95DRAFT_529080 [Leptodontidium sp. 2 PMI_412]|nr:hypothetical protein DL95DRAFT_529080 [Leptodontidium sp. 2 PMI_412]